MTNVMKIAVLGVVLGGCGPDVDIAKMENYRFEARTFGQVLSVNQNDPPTAEQIIGMTAAINRATSWALCVKNADGKAFNCVSGSFRGPRSCKYSLRTINGFLKRNTSADQIAACEEEARDVAGAK